MHDHPHSHPHSHEHEYEHEHNHAPMDLKQTKALLQYMLEHNRHHAEELHDLAHQLSGEGKPAAADRIHEAIHSYEEGNDLLEQALAAIIDE